MKQKQNAREKREAIKRSWKPKKKDKSAASDLHLPAAASTSSRHLTPEERARTEAEETKMFLEFIEKSEIVKDENIVPVRKRTGTAMTIPAINLEDGMPIVDEAVRRMNIGIQEMRVSGVKTVKLIHGYGSTGTGGRIRIGIRNELAVMKQRKLIRDFIPGESFGPFDERSRKTAERNKTITKDPDYGRNNYGVTIVVIW